MNGAYLASELLGDVTLARLPKILKAGRAGKETIKITTNPGNTGFNPYTFEINPSDLIKESFK
jgi:hypothetical protein